MVNKQEVNFLKDDNLPLRSLTCFTVEFKVVEYFTSGLMSDG